MSPSVPGVIQSTLFDQCYPWTAVMSPGGQAQLLLPDAGILGSLLSQRLVRPGAARWRHLGIVTLFLQVQCCAVIKVSDTLGSCIVTCSMQRFQLAGQESCTTASHRPPQGTCKASCTFVAEQCQEHTAWVRLRSLQFSALSQERRSCSRQGLALAHCDKACSSYQHSCCCAHWSEAGLTLSCLLAPTEASGQLWRWPS